MAVQQERGPVPFAPEAGDQVRAARFLLVALDIESPLLQEVLQILLGRKLIAGWVHGAKLDQLFGDLDYGWIRHIFSLF